MKITLYYEDKNHPTVLEVPDEECSVMVETDYKQRLEVAEDKSSVLRRSVQEILDEEVNKPTFNRNRAETRRHIQMSALEGDETLSEMPDMLGDGYIELYHAIGHLRPEHRELIRKIFWEDVKQIEIAHQKGITKASMSDRMKRIYHSLKKFMSE